MCRVLRYPSPVTPPSPHLTNVHAGAVFAPARGARRRQAGRVSPAAEDAGRRDGHDAEGHSELVSAPLLSARDTVAAGRPPGELLGICDQ